jgi:ActR/RegA family two-component response regulator
MNLLAWLNSNAEWVFSGIGISIFAAAAAALNWLRRSGPNPTVSPTVATNNHQVVNVNLSPTPSSDLKSASKAKHKAAISILFIDDEIKFQVVNILRRNGWTNTRIIKDVTSLEQPEVASADIFFVDIQGVGVSLGFKDQGLGLVIALRKKYPSKKIVIYSAENANAFHAAFGQANERISKDADPYEFMEAVERLSE